MPITLSGLCKAFDGCPVLAGLNAVFPDGAVSCITGPSGCGKTTLLRLLAGTLSPDSGTISGLSGRRIAAVFQEDRLIEQLSPVDNLRIVLRGRSRAEEILRALDAVGLSAAAHRPVRELSGGMKRRVAILRALLADADVLLLDEPFKGLDADTRAQVIALMRRHLAGRTVLLVTHDPYEADLLGGQIFPLNR